MTENQIETIILAGGKGTRLKNVLDDRPKPMAVINNKPFLEWILLMLSKQGIQRAVISTGHLGKEIESYFANSRDLGVEIEFVRDPFPLGTAGAIRNALDKTNSERVLVLNGDSYLRFKLSNFLNTHLSYNAKVSICLAQIEDSSRYGTVEVDNDGRVLAFLEKPLKKKPGLINSGVYLFERDVIKKIPKGKIISLEIDIFPNLINKGLYGVQCEGTFIDIGTPDSFNKANKLLRREFEYLLQKEKL